MRKFAGFISLIMEQKAVNFSVIKSKIIKTDEVLRKYVDSTNNVKKAQHFCKELKSKYEQVTQNLNRLELENERISFNLKTEHCENNELKMENNQLKERISSLEDHYNKFIIKSQSTIRNLEGELQMLQELNKFDSLSPVKKEQLYNDETIEKMKQLEKDSQQLQMLETEHKTVVNKLAICNEQLCEKLDSIEKDKVTIVKLSKENHSLQKELQALKNEVKLSNIDSKPCPIEIEKLKSNLSQKLKELETLTHENAGLKEHLFKTRGDLETAKAKINVKKPLLRNNCVQTVESIFNPSSHSYIEMNNMDTMEQSIEDIMEEMTKLPIMLSPLRENEDETKDIPAIENIPVVSEQDSKEDPLKAKHSNGRLLKRQKYRIPLISNELIKHWYNSGVIRKRKKMRKTKLIKKQEQDSILTALEILKRAKINFTISNESLLSWPRCGCDGYSRSMLNISSQVSLKSSSKLETETLVCDNCNSSSSQMILNKVGNQLELLGFVNIKKEIVIPTAVGMEHENLGKQLEKKRCMDSTVTQSFDRLSNKRSCISNVVHSGTQTEVEQSFENSRLSFKKPEYENNGKSLNRLDGSDSFVKFPDLIDTALKALSQLSSKTVAQPSGPTLSCVPNLLNKGEREVMEDTTLKAPSQLSSKRVKQPSGPTLTCVPNLPNKEEREVMQNNDSFTALKSHNNFPTLISPLSTTTNVNSVSSLKEADADMKDMSDSVIPNDILSIPPLDVREPISEDNIQTCPDSPDPIKSEGIEYSSPKVIPLESLDIKSPNSNRRSKRISEKGESPSLDIISDIYTCDRLQNTISHEMVESSKSDSSISFSKAEATQANSFCETIVSMKRKRGRPAKHTMENTKNEEAATNNNPSNIEQCSSLKTKSDQKQSISKKKSSVKNKKPTSKLQSKILREVRERRKLYQTKPTRFSRDIQTTTIVDKSNLCESNILNRAKPPETKINVEAGKKINVVQNILIPPDSSCPVDLLQPNQVQPDRNVKENITSRSSNEADYTSNDVLSKIIGAMNKRIPGVTPKLQRKQVAPSSIEDKEWRRKILDIADVLHRSDHNVGNYLVPKYNKSILSATWRKACFPSKMKLLMSKLLELSNDDEIKEDIITEFKRLRVDAIAEMILYQVSLDVNDTPDTKHYPAPLMTRTQRIFLALMVRLEKEKMENLIDTFLSKAEVLLFRVGCSIRVVVPITRLYVAICRLRGDVNLLRVFCCKAFFSIADLAVPLWFAVLTSWIEVFPKEADLINYPITKVLVQIIHLKSCNNDGYNLLPLKCLLHQFYGYPKERWNCDEMFDQLCQEYLRNPGDSTDFALRLFCKNKDSKWVSKKINEFFKPLIYKIPAENENFKATVIILLGNICRQFNRNKAEEEVILLDLQRWMEGLIEDNPSGLVPESAQLILRILLKKQKKTRKTGVKQHRKKTNKARISRSSVSLSNIKRAGNGR